MEVNSYSASKYLLLFNNVYCMAAQLHRQSGVTDVTARELVLEINNHLLFNVTEVQNRVAEKCTRYKYDHGYFLHNMQRWIIQDSKCTRDFYSSPCTRSQCSYLYLLRYETKGSRSIGKELRNVNEHPTELLEDIIHQQITPQSW